MDTKHNEHAGDARARTDRVLRMVFACAAALPVACDDELDLTEPATADDAAPSDASAPRVAATSPTLAEEYAVCPADRVIAVRTDGSGCHASLGTPQNKWEGASLLGDLLAAGEQLPPGLRDLCWFQWKSTTKSPPNITLLEPHYEAIESDCEVDWPQGELLSGVLALPLRDAFYRHLGRLDAASLPKAARKPVWVALADTASQADVEMNSDHAATMEAILTSVACPDPAKCPLDVSRHLALPLLENGKIDPVRGGFYGDRRHLARAIFASVYTWQKAASGGPIILNLSLGWDPLLFGGDEPPAAMPGPARAAYRTLQYAACQGALIVAAAGNRAGDACEEGPLAPALWEDKFGPTVADCKTRFGAVKPPPDVATRPLLYAVGGVAHTDRPLQNARPDGRPRLAAPAFLGVADEHPGLTHPLTGSSVAAAALTGIAGLVWSYHSTLTPGQVIDRIYGSGPALGAQADFGVGGTIHRASACRALKHSCSGDTCPNVGECPEEKVDTAALAAVADAGMAAFTAAGLVDEFTADDVSVRTICPSTCGEVELYTSSKAQGAPCTLDTVAGATRYTTPQPDWPTCSVCFMNGNRVAIELDEGADPVEVVQVLLEVSDGVTIPQRHLLHYPTLVDGRVSDFAIDTSRLRPTVLEATLHITSVTGETRVNPILEL